MLDSGFLQLWPLLPVVIGIEGLVGWPGWTKDLNDALPGFSWFLIGSGLLLYPFSTGLIDRQLIFVPGIVVALGAWLLWRRSRSRLR